MPHSDEPGRTFQIAMTIDQMFAGENPELPTIPLPDTTYKYTATPFMDGNWANAVANEKSIMDEYGWHTVAWVLYPSFAVIIDDIYNPIFLSVVSGFFAA